MTVQKLCEKELKERIGAIKAYVKDAEEILKEGDYLQSAVRLQEMDKYIEFEPLVMNIFDSIGTTSE